MPETMEHQKRLSPRRKTHGPYRARNLGEQRNLRAVQSGDRVSFVQGPDAYEIMRDMDLCSPGSMVAADVSFKIYGYLMVAVDRLAEFSPLGRPFWTSKPVTEQMVQEAVAEDMLIDMPVGNDKAYEDPWNHAQRIAHFVVWGLDDHDPIHIDVGCPRLQSSGHRATVIDDGNHRLAAAIIRGDTHIAAEVSGSVEYAKELLGIDI